MEAGSGAMPIAVDSRAEGAGEMGEGGGGGRELGRTEGGWRHAHSSSARHPETRLMCAALSVLLARAKRKSGERA